MLENETTGVVSRKSSIAARASPSSSPYLNFVSPPAADENGNAYTILLPDVAAPTPTQRQFQVEVDQAGPTHYVNLVVIPEPGVALLGAVALAGLAGLLVRRRR